MWWAGGVVAADSPARVSTLIEQQGAVVCWVPALVWCYFAASMQPDTLLTLVAPSACCMLRLHLTLHRRLHRGRRPGPRRRRARDWRWHRPGPQGNWRHLNAWTPLVLAKALFSCSAAAGAHGLLAVFEFKPGGGGLGGQRVGRAGATGLEIHPPPISLPFSCTLVHGVWCGGACECGADRAAAAQL